MSLEVNLNLFEDSSSYAPGSSMTKDSLFKKFFKMSETAKYSSGIPNFNLWKVISVSPLTSLFARLFLKEVLKIVSMMRIPLHVSFGNF